jgi:hypothetical protein
MVIVVVRFGGNEIHRDSDHRSAPPQDQIESVSPTPTR